MSERTIAAMEAAREKAATDAYTDWQSVKSEQWDEIAVFHKAFTAGWNARAESAELAALRERIAVMEKDASPWIPINSVEDLPKETGEYVVTMHTPSGLHVTTLRFYGVWHNISDRDTKLRILRHEYWLATSHATQWAVAYMPLPEPYQPAAQAPKAK